MIDHFKILRLVVHKKLNFKKDFPYNSLFKILKIISYLNFSTKLFIISISKSIIDLVKPG